jgi:hypothetical protein
VHARRGGRVARHRGGDVAAPRAEPHRRRLVRDAQCDLSSLWVAGMGPNPIGRQRVRARVELTRQRARADGRKSLRDRVGARQGSRDAPERVGGRVNLPAGAGCPVAAGVDDEPLGHAQIMVQLGRVTDLLAGRVVVRHVEREPEGVCDIGGSQPSRHLARRHPVRVARVQVHLIGVRLECPDRVGQHSQPGLLLGGVQAVRQLSERVGLKDHNGRPAADAGREPVDPLLVRPLAAFERRPALACQLRADEQISEHCDPEDDAPRDRSDLSPTRPRIPSHGWEYSPVRTARPDDLA